MNVSDHNAIEVRFCVNIGKNTCIYEKELEHDFDRYRETLLGRTDHEGAILISAPGQPEEPEVCIEDELQMAIPSVCFASIPQLLAGRPYVHSYFSMCGTVSFEPENHDVKISGSYIPDVYIRSGRLLEPLYCCGVRFIEYFHRLRGDEWHEIIDEFWAEARITKRALTSA